MDVTPEHVPDPERVLTCLTVLEDGSLHAILRSSVRSERLVGIYKLNKLTPPLDSLAFLCIPAEQDEWSHPEK